MALKVEVPQIVRLDSAQQKDLENAVSNYESAKAALDELQKMGVDVTALRDKLEWANENAIRMLKAFSNSNTVKR